MTDSDGQGLRPGTPYGGVPGVGTRPLSPRCPHTDPPAWLWWGAHCHHDATLRRKYGLTCDDYRQLLEAQEGRCGACGRPPKKTQALAVDHDHETNEIRGLLCTRCNQALTKGLTRYVLNPPALRVRRFVIPPDRVEALAKIRQRNAEGLKRARAARRANAEARDREPVQTTTETDYHAKVEAALAATKQGGT